MKIFLSTVFLLCWTANALSSPAGKSVEKIFGPVKVTVEISAEEITIGDVVTCRFTVESEPGVVLLTLPNLVENPGPFAVTDYTPPAETKRADGGSVTVLAYKLDPTLPGRYAIPPQEIRFQDRRPGQDSGERRFETPELFVQVKGLVDGEAEWGKLKDIRGARSGPIRIPWVWLGVILGVAAILAVLYRRMIGAGPAEPPMPAHVWAEIELDRLMRENLMDRGRAEEFVARLSDILRHYIERRYELRAPERTTEEFYQELKSTAVLNAEQKSAVHEFLRATDLVKFAATRIEPDAAAGLLQSARAFIRQTRAIEPAPEKLAA